MIKKVEFIVSGTNNSHFPSDDKNEYLFLGRSNVGKSSLINFITNRKNLAKTSQTPGKTITLNYYLINDSFYLVDAPGYGYAKRSMRLIEEFGKMVESFIQTRVNLKKVCILMDFKIGPTEDDLLMLDYVSHFNKEIVVIMTKIDKVNQSERAKSNKLIKEHLSKYKVIKVSALKRIGLEEVLKIFEEDLWEKLC